LQIDRTEKTDILAPAPRLERIQDLNEWIVIAINMAH
jgi:hypothetical protein